MMNSEKSWSLKYPKSTLELASRVTKRDDLQILVYDYCASLSSELLLASSPSEAVLSHFLETSYYLGSKKRLKQNANQGKET
jgi:hypothetical protein